ncbi:MAG: asparaginase [Actinomycetota bacterium]|nr:asparaginase [Actinomycetota bacterium]
MTTPRPTAPSDARAHQACPAVAEVVRSGFVEGHHYGRVVALDCDAAVLWAVGDVDDTVLPRSSNKPLQAVAMVRLGLDLPPDLLALAAASHSGEGFHLHGVRRILDGAGLDESALQTPPDHPLDERARTEALRAGVPPSPIQMNCSGKHAAMLATCVANDWDTTTYREPAHPLQQAIRGTIAELTGVEVAVAAVDGCGAPLLSTSLTGLARAFHRLALAEAGSAEHRVATALREHPEHASGTRRDEARLLRALPGTIGKAGAEACYAVALPDGRAVALKVEDGGVRARPVVMAAALRRLGVDHPVLDELAEHPVLGGGRRVGAVRAAF